MQLIYSPGMKLEDVEKEVIILALRFNNGNKTQTANSLGIAYRTLDEKLKKYEDRAEEIKKINEKRKEERVKLLRTQRGLPVEQINEPSKEQPLSVWEQDKVQEVPSTKNESSSSDSRHNQKNAQREARK